MSSVTNPEDALAISTGLSQLGFEDSYIFMVESLCCKMGLGRLKDLGVQQGVGSKTRDAVKLDYLKCWKSYL